MTKKRFKMHTIDGSVFLEDHEQGSYYIGERCDVDWYSMNNITDLLNELHDEIMELQRQNNTFKHFISEIIKNIQSQDDNQLLYIQSIIHQLE